MTASTSAHPSLWLFPVPDAWRYPTGRIQSAYEAVVRKQFGQWDEAWQRQHFEEKWSPEQFEIVEQAGQRIGTLSVSRTHEEVRILEIQVLPEFQGQGIGTQLLQRELRFADERALPVRLQVLRKNRARTLYERLGFRVCGETATHFLMERIGSHRWQLTAVLSIWGMLMA